MTLPPTQKKTMSPVPMVAPTAVPVSQDSSRVPVRPSQLSAAVASKRITKKSMSALKKRMTQVRKRQRGIMVSLPKPDDTSTVAAGSRTYKLQLESGGADLLIDGVYRLGNLFQKGGGTYTANRTGAHYISVAGTGSCIGLHGCTGSYTLSVTEE